MQPDLSVYCGKDRVDDKGGIGGPDLIIEILSPSTARKDLNQKTLLYLLHGVQEYWIVDPEKEDVLVHRLEDGRYGIPQIMDKTQTLSPRQFPELKIPLSEVFDEA